jgi:hypothetical protein
MGASADLAAAIPSTRAAAPDDRLGVLHALRRLPECQAAQLTARYWYNTVGVFGLQAFRSYGVAEKADRFPLFCVMGIGSLVALGAMRYFKPKTKEKK